MAKYVVEFSQESGQYAGKHSFHTKKAMYSFLEKAIKLGYKDFKELKK